MYKHHNQIVALYVPDGTINTQTVFIRPSEEVPFDAQMGNPSVAWEPFINAEYIVLDGAGNHFSMVSPINRQALSDQLSDCIAKYFED